MKKNVHEIEITIEGKEWENILDKSFEEIWPLLWAILNEPFERTHTFVSFSEGFPFVMWKCIGSLFSFDQKYTL